MSPTPIQSLPPALQLALRCCLPPDPDQPSAATVALLQRIEARAFVDLVEERHRIGPLAHGVLRKVPAELLPAGLLAPLAQAARANAIKALQAQRAHRLLATWFAAAGLDWMPFKGVTVAQAYYEDPAARHVNDLDVWVPPASLDQARGVLQAQGCRMLGADLHADLALRGPRHAAYLQGYYHEMQFCSAAVGHLELHWRLADNPRLFSLSAESVRARARTMTVGGANVCVMDHLDLLLYLCDHGARHGWGRLKWLADLPRLLNSVPWDWAEVFARADEARCRNSLSLGLGLCQHYLGWDAPDAVRAELTRCRQLPALMDLSLEFLQVPAMTKDPQFADVAASVWRELRLSLMLNPSLASVAHQAQRYLLSPKDLQALPLPDRLFAGYYLIRPLLLLARRTGLLRSNPV